MVDGYLWWFAAEIYKSFLYSASRLIRSDGGTITSYDGDRVMGIFVDELHRTRAIRCALKIHWVRENIINNRIKNAYTKTSFRVRHVCGIDTGELRAANTGIRGDNDLVWVGPAANYAAKLTTLDSEWATWISSEVHRMCADSAKYTDGKSMWESRQWNGKTVYRSNWWQSI